jgi:uncharacterized glyoxalase superfamily protein PhnB
MLKKVTPILTVDTIEPCLPFWTEHLGFQVTMAVPEEGPKAFAILVRDGFEIMYQTQASLAEDLGANFPLQGSIIYIEVDAVEPIAAAVPADSVAVPLRTTWYGATEIFVREPGGNVIGFAKQKED